MNNGWRALADPVTPPWLFFINNLLLQQSIDCQANAIDPDGDFNGV